MCLPDHPKQWSVGLLYEFNLIGSDQILLLCYWFAVHSGITIAGFLSFIGFVMHFICLHLHHDLSYSRPSFQKIGFTELCSSQIPKHLMCYSHTMSPPTMTVPFPSPQLRLHLLTKPWPEQWLLHTFVKHPFGQRDHVTCHLTDGVASLILPSCQEGIFEILFN